ncbi:hypothetical protein FNV43_RR01136 [Rhamnella rubrinervis]|uniref:Plastid lipid-associated protein/fibrillin conserved domain-containing protein n=1 Tax=Rhamnella rubrinervis TaxID=2594499 RepID=A0A8K0MRS7_9ROSA|nr:hypothetical protein FNV43_RR01136 [Rhamnella rubrinervis]
MSEIVSQAWKRYLLQLQLHPLRTKAITTGVIAGALWICLCRAIRAFPSKMMDAIFKERVGKTVVKQVVLEQLTVSPWNNFFSCCTMPWWLKFGTTGRPWGFVKSKLRKDYPSIQLTAWKKQKASHGDLSKSEPSYSVSDRRFHLSPFSSSSSSSSIRCLTPTKIHTVKGPKALTFHSLIRRRQSFRNTHRRKNLILRSSVDDVPVIDPPPPGPPPPPPVNPELIASLKLKLLGSRPGPPTRRLLPLTLGQVFQRIDTVSKDFDNIVELELGTPWPLPPVEVTATLAHKFEVIGLATIKTTFEKTTVKTRGNLSQLPPLELPRLPDGLRPPSDTRSGEFEVTYLDDDTRITRGDRGELRVFVIS